MSLHDLGEPVDTDLLLRTPISTGTNFGGLNMCGQHQLRRYRPTAPIYVRFLAMKSSLAATAATVPTG